MTVRELARRIPGARWTYRLAYDLWLRLISQERVFTDIYRNKKWLGSDSVSGLGSDPLQTRVISLAIPELIVELGIKSMHDIPCGDFFWMSRVDLGSVEYFGSDIVGELIESNKRTHARPCVHFSQANLLAGNLRRTDLMLVRDCLVHFSYQDVFIALKNITQSGSKYLLTTTFPDRSENKDIPTGRWRPINLQIAPFNLVPPVRIINEGCTEAGGAFSDKSLALWLIDDIRNAMQALS
jgi:hypothetical protein